MGRSDGSTTSYDTKLLAAVSVVAYGLAMFWMQTMWDAIERERAAREALTVSIAASYASRDVIESLQSQINRNTDRLIGLEANTRDLTERLSRVRADLAGIIAAEGISRDQLRNFSPSYRGAR